MLSTVNGCVCHMLSGTQCISCRERSKSQFKCKKCKVGIWNSDGDYEGHHGLCSQCHEDANPPYVGDYSHRY